MHVGRSLEEVRENVSNEHPDLLICDYDIPGGDFFDFVHSIRHSEIGQNPFLAIIAITRTPSPEVVQRVSECGVDHLIVKPFSTSQMMDRIRLLIEARKLFVVTSDYIGPDRRDDVERGSEVTRMNVPNTLKAKVVGKASAADIQRAIDLAVAEVNVQKLERYDDEIAFLVAKIVPSLSKGSIDDTALHFLERLVYVAGDASRRLVGTGYAHVSDLCQAMHSVTTTVVSERGKADPKDIQLLGLLAQAIKVGFGAGEDMIAAAHEISNKALSRFRQLHAERKGESGAPDVPVPTADTAVIGLVNDTGPAEEAPVASPAPPRRTPPPSSKPPASPTPRAPDEGAVAAASPQEGDGAGLVAATQQAMKIEDGKFEDVFAQCLREYIRQVLALWEIDGVPSGHVPFMLSARFRQRLCDVVLKHVAPAIPKNRRMVVLAGNVDRDNVSADVFWSMFDQPERENVPRFLWNNWWGEIGKALSAGGKDDAAKIWAALSKGAAEDGFDPPQVSDIPVIQALFDYKPKEIGGVMRGAQQVLQHEADEISDVGGARNYLLSQIESLPLYCGDWLALWAYYKQPAEFSNKIQKSFTASTGRTARERRAVLPYYLHWAPDLTRVTLDDEGNIIDPEAV